MANIKEIIKRYGKYQKEYNKWEKWLYSTESNDRVLKIANMDTLLLDRYGELTMLQLHITGKIGDLNILKERLRGIISRDDIVGYSGVIVRPGRQVLLSVFLFKQGISRIDTGELKRDYAGIMGKIQDMAEGLAVSVVKIGDYTGYNRHYFTRETSRTDRFDYYRHHVFTRDAVSLSDSLSLSYCS